MPPQGAYAKYKQHVRNYLFFKCGWDKVEASKWLNEHADFVRQMFATGAHYTVTGRAIDEMEKKVNAKS
jgi:hypothetical protein